MLLHKASDFIDSPPAAAWLNPGEIRFTAPFLELIHQHDPRPLVCPLDCMAAVLDRREMAARLKVASGASPLRWRQPRQVLKTGLPRS